jgi:ABC-2 type transport system ATP-binding protein
MTNCAIETSGLRKHYGPVYAVDGLHLRVPAGEIYVFLGLNGAGKTTTIRMLLGMVRPTAGFATVLGERVRQGSTSPWARVGYLVETPHAYPELSVRENLEAARLMHPGTPRRAVDEIIERLALGAYAERRAGALSLGNAQRLGLARALLHRPRLLILDEPANALDPAGIVEVRGLLLELVRSDGVTVFMSSHILAEAARLAQRVGILHQGRLIRELDAGALERERRRRLVIEARDLERARAALAGGGFAPQPNGEGRMWLAEPAAIERPDEVAALLAAAGAPPAYLAVEEEGLEAYFLRLVGAEHE